ncbi:MAG TPA: tetratricopeptide repeat protein [Terriglobales bacterium]|nr:tetratricopeptide repeat protein [Terriglobales bacterium]
MDKKPAETNQALESNSKFNLLIAVLCGLLILAHFISSFFPKSRLWGINHLGYFPLWLNILITVAGLSVLIPWFNQRISFYLTTLLAFAKNKFSSRKYLWYLLFAFISIPIFYFLRDRTHFLGDGAQLISLLDSGKLNIKWTEPLEVIAHLYLYRFLNLFLKVNAQTVYASISILSGAILVYFLFLFSELLGRDDEKGLLVFFVLGTMGAIQLFFGYAEHYTLLYLFVLAYLYFSLRFLKNKTGLMPVMLTFLLSVFSHFSAFYLFPSLFFLLWNGFEFRNKQKRNYFRWIITVLSLAGLSGFTIFYLENKWMLGQVFVPLYPGNYYAPDYTMFSLPHFADLLSLQLLLSPLGVILILTFLLGLSRISKGNFSLQYKSSLFLILVALFQLGYNFILNPGLGMARDWDLFSATALGYTILGIYLLFQTLKEKAVLRYASTALIFTSFLFTLPWILINHNPQLSINRFENLLNLDLKKSRNGRYALAQYYSARGMQKEKDKVSDEFNQKLPEINLTEIGLRFYNQGKIDAALGLLQRVVLLEPGFPEAHNFLGLAYYKTGKTEEAELEFRKTIELRPDYVDAYVNLGNLYTTSNQVDQAIKTYEKAVKLKTEEPDVYSNLALYCLAKNQVSRAKAYIKKALVLRPDSPNYHLNLGVILIKFRDLDGAEKELLRTEQLKEDYYVPHYYLSQIYATKGEKEKSQKEYELFLKYKPENLNLPLTPLDTVNLRSK